MFYSKNFINIFKSSLKLKNPCEFCHWNHFGNIILNQTQIQNLNDDGDVREDDDDIDDDDNLQCSDDLDDESLHQQIWNQVGNIILNPTQIQHLNDDGDDGEVLILLWWWWWWWYQWWCRL